MHFFYNRPYILYTIGNEKSNLSITLKSESIYVSIYAWRKKNITKETNIPKLLNGLKLGAIYVSFIKQDVVEGKKINIWQWPFSCRSDLCRNIKILLGLKLFATNWMIRFWNFSSPFVVSFILQTPKGINLKLGRKSVSAPVGRWYF